MHVSVQVARFNPDTDAEPRLEPWTVEVEDGARVLNVLDAIHSRDPTLHTDPVVAQVSVGVVRSG